MSYKIIEKKFELLDETIQQISQSNKKRIPFTASSQLREQVYNNRKQSRKFKKPQHLADRPSTQKKTETRRPSTASCVPSSSGSITRTVVSARRVPNKWGMEGKHCHFRERRVHSIAKDSWTESNNDNHDEEKFTLARSSVISINSRNLQDTTDQDLFGDLNKLIGCQNYTQIEEVADFPNLDIEKQTEDPICDVMQSHDIDNEDNDNCVITQPLNVYSPISNDVNTGDANLMSPLTAHEERPRCESSVGFYSKRSSLLPNTETSPVKMKHKVPKSRCRSAGPTGLTNKNWLNLKKSNLNLKNKRSCRKIQVEAQIQTSTHKDKQITSPISNEIHPESFSGTDIDDNMNDDYLLQLRIDHEEILYGWEFMTKFTDISCTGEPSVILKKLKVDNDNYLQFSEAQGDTKPTIFDPSAYFQHIQRRSDLKGRTLKVEVFSTKPLFSQVINTKVHFNSCKSPSEAVHCTQISPVIVNDFGNKKPCDRLTTIKGFNAGQWSKASTKQMDETFCIQRNRLRELRLNMQQNMAEDQAELYEVLQRCKI